MAFDPVASPHLALSSGLSQAGRHWRRAANALARAHGISDATALPLVLIGRAEGRLRQAAMAEAVGVEPPSLVRLLDQLCGAGLEDTKLPRIRVGDTATVTVGAMPARWRAMSRAWRAASRTGKAARARTCWPASTRPSPGCGSPGACRCGSPYRSAADKARMVVGRPATVAIGDAARGPPFAGWWPPPGVREASR